MSKKEKDSQKIDCAWI